MDHDALLSTIYAAAAGETDWAEIPRALCEAFDGAAALVTDGYLSDPASFRAVDRNFGEEELASGGFVFADNFDPATNQAFARAMVQPLNQSFDTWDVYAGGTERQRTFVHRCLVSNGILPGQTFTVLRDGGAVAGGFVAPSIRRGPMAPEAVARLDATLTHLRRAIDMRLRLEIGRAAQESLAEIVAHLGSAVLLLDRQGRILLRNAVADELLQAADGVREARGRLHLTDPASDALLRRRMERLYTPGSLPTETPLQARRRGGLPPLSVSLFRTTGFALATGAYAAFASLVVTDPCDEARLPSVERLQGTLGLTPAEASVARLTPLALSRRRIAERLGVAESTVKTHLSSIRGKLGAGSTAAVALIVSRIGKE
ncbi:MAG: LuxR C-terminal-related transcriptional regulator [Paracoccaceae bacterium]